MKILGLTIVILFGAMLVYGSLEFPPWGDPSAPASRHVSPHYIENTVKETSVPNIVTAVLADYRGYDTMFETIVIFAAGLACFFLLRTRRTPLPDYRMYRHIPTGITLRIEKGGKLPEASDAFEQIDSVWIPYDVIAKTTCRVIIPFIQIFALYVIFHGHYSPGGGFQGGVILGASVILFALVFNLRQAMARMGERLTVWLCVAGVLIYTGTGMVSLIDRMNFLDYGALAGRLGVDAVTARSHGILIVEMGVGLSVMAVMVALYYLLASGGRMDEGL